MHLLALSFLLGNSGDQPAVTNLAMWAIVVGSLTPPVVAFVNRLLGTKNASWERPAIMIGFAIVDGVGTAYFQGSLTGQRFLQAALIAGVAIIAAYQGVWKPTGVAGAIEQKTPPLNAQPRT